MRQGQLLAHELLTDAQGVSRTESGSPAPLPQASSPPTCTACVDASCRRALPISSGLKSSMLHEVDWSSRLDTETAPGLCPAPSHTAPFQQRHKKWFGGFSGGFICRLHKFDVKCQ